jgi:hypothetical protein
VTAAPIRLAVFAAILVVAFLAAFAVGATVKGDGPTRAPVHQEHTP